MPELKVLDMAGKEVGSIALADTVFGVEVNAAILHSAVRAYLANQRQGTQSTLTRTEVSGGGKKPWRQKGTGRARQGSTRAPQWTHGGVALGPKPRSYRIELNRKEKRLALKSAMSDKVASGNMIVLDSINADAYKTRVMADMLKAIGAYENNSKKSLIVLEGLNDKVTKSLGNIPGVKLAYVNTINAYDILNADKFIVVKAAVQKIEEVYA